jgi:hypothetical protein
VDLDLSLDRSLRRQRHELLLVTFSGEGEDAAPLVDGDLAEDVSGGAKALTLSPTTRRRAR